MSNRQIDVGTKFTGDASDFKKAATDAQKAAAALRKSQAAETKKMEADFKKVTMAIAKVGGAILAAREAFNLFSDVMKSTEGGSDALEASLGGLKESSLVLKQSISQLDFSNLISDLIAGYENGKKFTEMLDALTEKTAYNDYKISKMNREAEGFREIIKNKELEIGVREDAARKILAIEEKIYARKKDLIDESFSVEKEGWEKRNKMTMDQSLKDYEIVDNMADDIKERLETTFNYQKSLFGTKTGVSNILSGTKGAGTLRGIPKEVIESYARFFMLSQNGEADVMVKMFTALKVAEEGLYDAQKELNTAVKETSTIFVKDAAATTKAMKDQAEVAEDLTVKLTDLKYVAPDGGDVVDHNFQEKSLIKETGTGATANIVKIAKDATKEYKALSNVVNTLESNFTNLFLHMGGGFKGMIDSMIDSFKLLVAQLVAKAAIFGILSLITGGSSGAGAGVFKAITGGKGFGAFMGLANGGIVSGETLARVGEYAGAKSNPEVVAPLSELKGMLGSNNVSVNVEGKIRGKDLALVLTRYNSELQSNT